MNIQLNDLNDYYENTKRAFRAAETKFEKAANAKRYFESVKGQERIRKTLEVLAEHMDVDPEQTTVKPWNFNGYGGSFYVTWDDYEPATGTLRSEFNKALREATGDDVTFSSNKVLVYNRKHDLSY